MIFHFHQHSEKKKETQTFGGVSNLTFFIMIDIKEMAAIFFIMADADIQFPLTLTKPETKTLGGVSNLKFFCTINIKEMAAIF